MYSVLYVDDDPILCDVAQTFLNRIGTMIVETADSAGEGLQMHQKRGYDAIVSDYEMPIQDGISFLKDIRNSGDKTPFILFTGRGREEVAMDALNNGADFYLQKGGGGCQFSELANMIGISVQKHRSEMEIQRSRQEMEVIISHLPDPTFAINADGKVIAWNGVMEDLTGIAADEILGKGDYEYAIPFYGKRRPLLLDYLIYPSDEYIEYYKKICRSDLGITASTTCTMKGQEYTFWIKATALTSPDGTISGAITSLRDTTQRIRLLRRLHGSKTHFETIIDHLPDPTFAIDVTGNVIAWNRAMEDLTRVKKDQIIGMGEYLYAEAIYQKKRTILLDCLLNQKPVDPSLYDIIKREDDSLSAYVHIGSMTGRGIRTLWATAALLRSASGEVFGVIESIKDISKIQSLEQELRAEREALSTSYEELEVAQEELRESYETLSEWQQKLEENERKYRFLIENCNDGIFLIRNGVFAYVNPACCAMSGYSEDELGTMDPYLLMHPDEQERFSSLISGDFKEKTEPSRYTCQMLTKNGEKKMIKILLEPARYHDSDAILGRVRDVDDQIRAEKALHRANKKLQLLSGITRHDIKNHLTSLQSAIYMLEDFYLPEDGSRLLQILSRSADSIDRDISFTSIYQDIGSFEPVWAGVHEGFFAHSGLLISHGIEFFSNIPENLEIYVDPLFSKVCYNLIENGIRHGEGITTMNVSCRQDGHDLSIRIRDDGKGVPAEHKKKIFLRGHGRNTGLGLFLTREILSITGIRIEETGIEGSGAWFEILVPSTCYRFSGKTYQPEIKKSCQNCLKYGPGRKK